jgi:cell division protein ZapA
MSSAESIEVTIFNQTYSLRSMSGGEHVRQIASLVDERMRLIASSITTHDISKIAILAALNIADEMQSLKAQQAEEMEQQSPSLSSVERDEERGSGGDAGRQAESNGAAASWFDDIFDADMTPARDRGNRLSSQVSAKLQSLRKTDAQPPNLEGAEDRRRS